MNDPPAQAPPVLAYGKRKRAQLGWIRRAALVLAWAYPFLPVVSLYVTWLVAWTVLGRQPRPMLDDPKFISPIVDLPYAITALLILTIPIGLPIGIAAGMLLTPE